MFQNQINVLSHWCRSSSQNTVELFRGTSSTYWKTSSEALETSMLYYCFSFVNVLY